MWVVMCVPGMTVSASLHSVWHHAVATSGNGHVWSYTLNQCSVWYMLAACHKQSPAVTCKMVRGLV